MAETTDISFLYEVGTLRYVPRMWRQFLNKDYANVAEHTFRVLWIALLLAKKEGANEEKVMKMALFHDLTETRIPDVQYMSRQYTTRHEEKAIRDTLKNTSFEQEFLSLFFEYQERKTIESQVVKDADVLDVTFEICEQYAQGTYVKEEYERLREQARESIYTESARKLWTSALAEQPHKWHISGNNCYNKTS